MHIYVCVYVYIYIYICIHNVPCLIRPHLFSIFYGVTCLIRQIVVAAFFTPFEENMRQTSRVRQVVLPACRTV